MSLVKIYRIEDSNGVGPYQRVAGTPRAEMGAEHSWCDDHPCAREDYINTNIWMIYGFDNSEAAVVWFDGWLEKLEEWGYQMTEWLVDPSDIEEGNSGRQVRFRRGLAECIARYSPTEIYSRG